jgi:tRNA-2-methylthio-N6-dimethylallyladenosine synthase
MEGCSKDCAYCVVPFTRGPERSRTARSVLEEAARLADGGCTEIQLLGQNVNSYADPSGTVSGFAELLDAVARTPGLRRVRFTTSHPRDFGKDIVDVIDANPVLANHVHLPVQSGSTRVLGRMRRQYTRDEYLERIGWIKDARRRIAISTDMIVGFPAKPRPTSPKPSRWSTWSNTIRCSASSIRRAPTRRHWLWTASAGCGERRTAHHAAGEAARHTDPAERGTSGRDRRGNGGGYNKATSQWIGRTLDNRVLNSSTGLVPARRAPAGTPGYGSPGGSQLTGW